MSVSSPLLSRYSGAGRDLHNKVVKNGRRPKQNGRKPNGIRRHSDTVVPGFSKKANGTISRNSLSTEVEMKDATSNGQRTNGKAAATSNFTGKMKPDAQTNGNYGKVDIAAQKRLEEMLRNPIRFVPATSLTLDDEAKMKSLAQSLRTASSAHRRRRAVFLSTAIPTTWPAQIRAAPRGLDNPAALCYRRSVLQSLMQIPVFLNWLNPTLSRDVMRDHQHTGKYPNAVESCLLCKMRNLLATCWSESASANEAATSLIKFDKAIAIAGRITTPRWKYVTSYVQADAHEFLCWLLEIFETYFNKPRHIVDTLFKVRMESEWVCTQCRTIHTGPGQNEIGLGIQLANPDQGNLATYISAYFNETIQGVRCDSCQSTANRVRTRSISAAPEVLVVQLQRFQRTQNLHTGRIESRKITKDIQITECLDLSEYASEALERAPGTLRYRLSSVVHHAGSLNNGHYITVARGPQGVVKFDDEILSRSSMREMLDPGRAWTPYILTYLADYS